MVNYKITIIIFSIIFLLSLLLYNLYYFIFYRNQFVFIVKNVTKYIYSAFKKIINNIFYIIVIPIVIYLIYLLSNLLFYNTKSSYPNTLSYSDI